VSIAASIAVHLVHRGFSVRLVTAVGEDAGGTWHEHGALSAETAPLLESLAVLTDTTHPHIDLRWLQEVGHSGLLFAVLGDVADHDRPVLTRMRHTAASAMAVALDVPAWARGSSPGSSSTAQTTAWLATNGWRSVSAAPGDPLPAVWQELGTAGRGSTGQADRSRSVSASTREASR
jgi:hypothetical protein